MLTFKEEKSYAIKMWKEIRSLLRKKNVDSDLYYTNAIASLKRYVVSSINAEIDRNTKPGAKYNCIKWKYDCILCQYANPKGNGCSACPLVRMGFPMCQDSCSPYDTISSVFNDRYREEVDIRKAERACDTIMRAIRKLTKKINYDDIK